MLKKKINPSFGKLSIAMALSAVTSAIPLTVLLISLMFLNITPSIAAPLLEERSADGMELERQVTENQLASTLSSGLRAGQDYTYQRSIQIETPFTFLPKDSTSTMMSGLCDLVAYAELVAKVTDSLRQQNGALEDIRMIIEQNVKDACQWVKFMNLSESNASDIDTPCTNKEMTNFKQQCVNLRVLSNNDAMLVNVQKTVSTYFGTRSDLEVSANPCEWVRDLETISDEQRNSILSSIHGGLC